MIIYHYGLIDDDMKRGSRSSSRTQSDFQMKGKGREDEGAEKTEKTERTGACLSDEVHYGSHGWDAAGEGRGHAGVSGAHDGQPAAALPLHLAATAAAHQQITRIQRTRRQFYNRLKFK